MEKSREPERPLRDFRSVGGLGDQLEALKDLMILPLLYRELYTSHGMEIPRGVLFHGPPGTGKTLVAGAVASECCKTGNRVTFYKRKGADCLNKYVGESEKNLQNLFSTAANTKPSIIFFDELDGLAPARSDSDWGQVQSSVVSTLLALMDGLDSSSQVFVIGATNRIDKIDPALRRPGRFDRELYFPLPALTARLDIFKIHTSKWLHQPHPDTLVRMARSSAGFCGADIKALCGQAVLESLHREYPQVSDTTRKLIIKTISLTVTEEDLWAAHRKTVPTSQRASPEHTRPLPRDLEPLLGRPLAECIERLRKSCPFDFMYHNEPAVKRKTLLCPRWLVAGAPGRGLTSHLAPAILNHLDHLPVTLLDLASLTSEDGEANLHLKMMLARRTMPGILYLSEVTAWWENISNAMRQTLASQLQELDASPSCQLFIFGVADIESYDELPTTLQKIFPRSKMYVVEKPSTAELTQFFSALVVDRNKVPPSPDKSQNAEPFGVVNLEVEVRRSRRSRDLDVEFSGLPFNSGKQRSQSFCDHPYCSAHSSSSVSPHNPSRAQSNPIVLLKRCRNRSDPDVCERKKTKPPEKSEDKLVVDIPGLQNIVKLAVSATELMDLSAVIELLEDLEVIAVKYRNSWDRSGLVQELETELQKFVASSKGIGEEDNAKSL